MKRIISMEVEQCRPGCCPYCGVVNDKFGDPLAFICALPKNPLGRLLEVSEIREYEKTHGSRSFPYSIPELCGLEPYGLLRAAMKDVKEHGCD